MFSWWVLHARRSAGRGRSRRRTPLRSTKGTNGARELQPPQQRRPGAPHFGSAGADAAGRATAASANGPLSNGARHSSVAMRAPSSSGAAPARFRDPSGPCASFCSYRGEERWRPLRSKTFLSCIPSEEREMVWRCRLVEEEDTGDVFPRWVSFDLNFLPCWPFVSVAGLRSFSSARFSPYRFGSTFD